MTADRERHDKRSGEPRASFAEPFRFDARRAEDMSFTRPTRLACLGEELSGFRGWTDVYRNLARILVVSGRLTVGRGVRYAADGDEPFDIAPGVGATRAAEKGGLERRDFGAPGYYLALRRNPTWILTKIRALVAYVGLEPREYEIEYERTPACPCHTNANANLATAASTMAKPRLSQTAFEKEFLEFENARGKGLFAQGHLNSFREAAKLAREWGGNLYANLTSTRPETALQALDELTRCDRYNALEEATRARLYSAVCELREFWSVKANARASMREPESEILEWDAIGKLELEETKPTRLVLCGEEIVGFQDWTSLYARCVQEFIARKLLRKTVVRSKKSGAVMIGEARDRDEINKPALVPGTNLYLATFDSVKETVRLLNAFRKLVGLKKDELEIEVRRGVEKKVEENADAKTLSNREAVAKFCDENGVFTMDELEKVVHENPAATSTILGWIGEKTIRLSYDKFIVKGTIQFNVPETDKFLEQFCVGDYVPIRHIIDAGLWNRFPKATTPWNEFLLESYLDGVSEKFALWSMGRRKKGVVGAMVRKATRLQSYDELLADALARTPLELNKKNALDYFGEEKLLLRKFYGTIANVLKLAQELRRK